MNDAGPSGAGKAALSALSGARFFDGVPLNVLSMLAGEAESIEVGAGEALFSEGDDSSDLFVLRSGALAILRRQADGSALRVGDIFAGEMVGEIAALTGEPRTATVVALRDSELVRVSRTAVGALIARDPNIALTIARVLARRLMKVQSGYRPTARPRAFAILPHANLAPARVADFVARLMDALRAFGKVGVIDSTLPHRSRALIQRCEARHDFVLFLGEGSDPDWSQFCARQADLVLLLADGDSPPAASPSWAREPDTIAAHELQRELALLGDEARAPSGSGAWADFARYDFLHHVRAASDMARLARLITRRATTIVLSGGGARGFAHLGVVDALHEAGVAIDIYGGSSMGGIIAAAYAGGWPRDMVRAKMRGAFVTGRPLSDPVLPIVALFRGRKVAWLLEQAFGDMRIEDLRQPFFCVSSCLTRAAPAVHRVGLLRRWLQASVAIPGVLPPLIEDGVVYVDGGIIDNLPIDAALALMRGPVIGVDVSGEEHFDPADPPVIPLWHRWFGGRRQGDPTIMETLWRVGTVGSVSTIRRDQDNAALIIRPPVGSLGLLDWKKFDRAVEIGYEHTRRLIAEKPELFAGLRRAQ